jgi:threonine dehydratase
MAPETKLIGFEPLGSPSMYNSLKTGNRVVLDELETFVDGAAMKNTGQVPWVIFILF